MTKKGCAASTPAGRSCPWREVGDPGTECAILDLVVRHGTPAVRPDDVFAALAGRRAPAARQAALAQRLARARSTTTGTVADPLAPDRDAALDG